MSPQVLSSESGEKHAQIKYCLQVKTVQANMLEYSDERTTGDLSLDEALSHILARSNSLKFKNAGLVLTKTQLFISHDVI